MGGFFIHSRDGLETVYMGQEWMELVRSTVETAEALDMQAWLYDEDRWPSGFAGDLFKPEAATLSRQGSYARGTFFTWRRGCHGFIGY